MLTQIINGKIFTPQGWLDEGSVLMRDNKILEVTNCDLALIGANLIDAKGMYIVPGVYGRGIPHSCQSTSETRCHQYFPDIVIFSFFRDS